MSRWGPQALPTARSNIVPQPTTEDPSRLNRVSLALRNTGGADQNVTLMWVGGDERTFLFIAGGALLLREVALLQASVDGGTVLAYIATEPEYMDPHYLGGVISNPTTVTNTVKTDLTQQEAGLGLDSSLQAILTKVTSIDNKVPTGLQVNGSNQLRVTTT